MKQIIKHKSFLLYRIIAAVTIIAVVALAVHWIPFETYVQGTTIQRYQASVHSFIGNCYWVSVALYIFFQVLITALSIPISIVVTMLGGYLFGMLPTVVYVNIGTTIGSMISFLLFRNFIGEHLQHQYQAQLAHFNKQINRYGAYYFLALRFVSVIPFAVENLLASLTTMRLWTFMWTTSLGIIPGSILYAYLGACVIDLKNLF